MSYYEKDDITKYLPSSQVKVFPCGWRGRKTVGTDAGDDKYIDLDIESKLTTEYNYTHLGAADSANATYIRSFDSNNWDFVIGGYHFRIYDVALADMLKFVTIDLREVALNVAAAGEMAERTKVLRSWHKVTSNESNTSEECLDFYDEETNTYYFSGLAFSDTDLSKDANTETTASITLQLKTEDGKINKAAFLPKISSGLGDCSICIGDDISVTGDNIIAAGNNIRTVGTGVGTSILLGHAVSTSGTSTVTLGSNILSTKNKQVAIGNYKGDENEDGLIEPLSINTEDIAIVGDYGVVVGITNTEDSYNINFNKANEIKFINKNDSENEKITFNMVADYNVAPLATVNGMIHLNGGFDLKENNTSYLKTNFTNDKKVSSLQLDIPLTTSKNVEIQDELKITKNNNSLLISSANTAATDFVNLTCNGETDPIKVTDGTNTVSIDKSFNLDYTANEDAELTVTLGSQKINLDKDLLDVATKLHVSGNTVLKNNVYINGTVYFGKDTETDNDNFYIKSGGEIKATTFWATSDRRAKENISEYKSQKSILDLPVYKYDYINGPKNQIGCMAQDLREICPEMVHEETNGMLSVDNSKIVYLLLDEVKKLKKELNALKTK